MSVVDEMEWANAAAKAILVPITDPPVDRKVLAFSGGADSTSMAYELHERGERFTLLFTPTGDELPDVWPHVVRTALAIGAPLVLPTNKSLLDWIMEFKALPNHRQRWCTRLIKIVPCIAYLKRHPNTTLLVGLRADEEEREGMYGDHAKYRFPLRELGWTRADVLASLKRRGVVVPKRTDCGVCLTGDARVMVRGIGLARMGDLPLGVPLEVWSGKAWRSTSAVMNGHRSTVTLRVTGGAEVSLTADHKVLTRDRGMVAAENLLSGERLVAEPPSMSPFPVTANLPPIVEPPRHDQARNVVSSSLPAQWSYEVGAFLGYVVGDGTANLDHAHPTVSICSAPADRGDLDRLREVVSSWCGTRTRVVDYTAPPNPFVPSGESRMCRIAWRALPVARLLIALGIDKRSDPSARRVPGSIWTASQDGVRGFLSGLFSTDGTVCLVEGDRRRIDISLAAVSRPLLLDVQQLLFALGIRSTVHPHGDDRVSLGYRELWTLQVSSISGVRAFAERVGFFNARKAAILRGALPSHERRVARTTWPRVVTVEKNALDVPVYDLVDVGEEHQFVANTISVSNCPFQRLSEWRDLWRDHPERYAEGERLEEVTGFTFRSPHRDTWPAALKDLRKEFERGRPIRGDGKRRLGVLDQDGAEKKCRVCSG